MLLALNADENQGISRRSYLDLRESVSKNPHTYDGLTLFSEEGDALCELSYSEIHEGWETAEVLGSIPFEVTSFDTLEDALEDFISTCQTYGYTLP